MCSRVVLRSSMSAQCLLQMPTAQAHNLMSVVTLILLCNNSVLNHYLPPVHLSLPHTTLTPQSPCSTSSPPAMTAGHAT
jgi:hypothetical protein